MNALFGQAEALRLAPCGLAGCGVPSRLLRQLDTGWRVVVLHVVCHVRGADGVALSRSATARR